ncbi:MAG: sigma-70 family RNA polymerase sigma factor [Phycisphaerales bacterium]|nr:sigma-70 family RNA polymerase sigma factor [Phycisphaerales bacterium]
MALVQAIIRGDQSAWRLLLGRHQTNVYNLCLRLVANRDLAEDLAQDTLVKIVQNIRRFDGRAKFSTWLYRITMNVCLSRLRAEKVRRHGSLDAVVGGAGHRGRDGGGGGGDDGPTAGSSVRSREPDARLGVQTGEQTQQVLRALASLEPEQRAILVLRDTRDFDYDQIAVVLEVPVGTVKSRLFRARAALREALESLGSGDSPGSEGSAGE